MHGLINLVNLVRRLIDRYIVLEGNRQLGLALKTMEIEVESLFDYAMKGQWSNVLEACMNNPGASEAEITKPEDTVLHIAVYQGQTNFVSTLLDNITQADGSLKILSVGDSRGNTPLHLAAELGNVDICNCIARRDPNLISCRNFEGETPLFLAAIQGKRDAFFCLHAHLRNKDDYSLCRKSNGDTILHSTISRECFGLALQIIVLYPSLADSVNEEGLSPLHILARKPNCFKSSTRMEFLHRVIYHCLIVDYLKEEAADVSMNRGDAETTRRSPMNYETCMNFLYLLKSTLKVITIGKNRTAETEENLSRKSYLRHEQEDARKERRRPQFPPNWEAFIRFLILMMKALLIIFGVGASWIEKIQRKKEKHVRAKQVMDELIQRASSYKYGYNSGRNPHAVQRENGRENKEDNSMNKGALERKRTHASPILIAAKMGVTEMVEKILDTFPVAVQDVDTDNKNVVLLAIENRQPHVYKLLTERKLIKESAFRQVDNQGNSALHLAATYRDHKPWRVPGAALQMQWECKWYKLVKGSMPPNFFERYNKKGQTAKQIFINTHKQLTKEGVKWLSKTSDSCSVVAALVASVAFTTSTTIPGGPNQNTGIPLLGGEPSFDIFAVASLVALCSSVTALVLFLSVLTSLVPRKGLQSGLTKKASSGNDFTLHIYSICVGNILCGTFLYR